MTDGEYDFEQATRLAEIAARAGRSRAAFEVDLNELCEQATGDDHLTFMEVNDLDGLSEDRTGHLDQCEYCRRLVEIIYRPLDITTFDRKLEAELAEVPRPSAVRSRLSFAATMSFGIVLGVVGVTVGASSIPYDRLLAIGRQPSPDEEFFRTNVPYGSIIYREARRSGLPPELVAAVVQTDSDFRPTLVSSKNAKGLMQITPDRARLLGVDDPFDPTENVRAGAKYLRYLMDRFGDSRVAVAAYNAGEGNVERFGGVPPFPETIDYVRDVSVRTQFYRQRLRSAYGAEDRKALHDVSR